MIQIYMVCRFGEPWSGCTIQTPSNQRTGPWQITRNKVREYHLLVLSLCHAVTCHAPFLYQISACIVHEWVARSIVATSKNSL